MEFSVRSNDDVVELFGNGLVLDKKEQQNLEDLLGNMVYGCALVISTAIQYKARTPELRKNLADLSIRMLKDVLDEHLEDANKNTTEESLYRKMEAMFDEWFEDQCTYDSRDDLIDDCREYDPMPVLYYDERDETVDVYLKAVGDVFSEYFGSVPVDLYKDNPKKAEATIFAFELAMVVLFDRVYGDGEENHLRSNDWVHLDKQLGKFLADHELI